jgi:molybdopterin-guanine dinucleotide biosynthesis protein A
VAEQAVSSATLSDNASPPVSVCLLAGGEGRRMGGQDKGLVNWAGQPLALSVLQRVAPQAGPLMVSANRHADGYAALIGHLQTTSAMTPPALIFPDDPDLPPRSGPLAGMLSALRRVQGDWLQVVPCDTPRLPADLIQRLLNAAMHAGADLAVPQTEDGPDSPRPHWVCALLHRRTLPSLEAQFAAGERKVSRWVCTQPWTSVFFEDRTAFTNINTMETPHAGG